ncbi:latent transforming growth factor beta-binding protein [Pyxidicoccus fallax]|uniref:Latent transforming growth factor beta-binding protein n=1 Tax=Pyxidicoccus fallax TaxID=394095 RepID=A0A848LAC7_9BACT|nr:latent transforming growth factor beta-binding protein [Pyxidicoccus fallax]NMO13643.1 latent transforming growth factor beta-binding protein [Pyxidicoccus fallax]NPC76869.1 latent transforming growth factor beta-binding protein [Pyxidicoccus fallax]
MRPSASGFLALLGLLTLLGCPLDIQVRSEEVPDAGCEDDDCATPCVRDSECPDGQRCRDIYDRCEPGARITEPCAGLSSCPGFSNCKNGRCELACSRGCPLGYRCGPESLCVEECTQEPPETLGDHCDSSMDCTRCGFCVDAGGTKRCHQPCKSDEECPDGAAGSCQPVPGSSLRVCRLS